MTAQIVEIAGKKMAMIPADEYEHLLDIVEDKADSLAAFEAQRRREAGEEYLPSVMVDRLLGGDHPLRVWRNYRGLTLVELADAIGMTHASLSRIENGKQQPKAAQWRALAEALNVELDDIVPLD
tara:strand:+ start:401 stop:775 length:375 start_codon:yes stop_codon:yes gene_type:complete